MVFSSGVIMLLMGHGTMNIPEIILCSQFSYFYSKLNNVEELPYSPLFSRDLNFAKIF